MVHVNHGFTGTERGRPGRNKALAACRSGIFNPHDPVGRLLFNVLGLVAEFEADFIRPDTRGLAVAEANSKLRGRQPKLSKKQESQLINCH